MEDNNGSELCPNCNRDIPKWNYVIHCIHCLRNIKVCAVCKEPVPQSELEDHNDRLHMLVPCTQCGEQVRGTDMEDHIRDSCAFTLQTCRYCSLELRRREVPAHERYCGARTERCADCGEYVMLRYRPLHLESNHGFVRLDDDSPPRQSARDAPNRPPGENRPRFPPYVSPSSLVRPDLSREESLRLIAQCRANHNAPENAHFISDEDIRRRIMANLPLSLPRREDRHRGDEGWSRLHARERMIADLRGRPRQHELETIESVEYAGLPPPFMAAREVRRRNPFERYGVPRNPVPQNNVPHEPVAGNEAAPDAAGPEAVAGEAAAAAEVAADVSVAMATELGLGEEVIEPPSPRPSTGSRTRSNYRVILKRTNDQPQINTAVTAQDKVSNKIGTRGGVKKRPAPAAPGSAATSPTSPSAPLSPLETRRDLPYYSAMQRRDDEDRRREEDTVNNFSIGLPPVLDPAAKLEKLRKMDALHNRDNDDQDYQGRLQTRVWYSRNNNNVPLCPTMGRSATNTSTSLSQANDAEDQRKHLADLEPMSAEEFMKRFNGLQLFKEPPTTGDAQRGDIRSSLRELRRGLNEVTAPYNNSASNNNNNIINNNNTNKNNNIIENTLNAMVNGIVQETLQLDEARAPDTSDRSSEADVMVPCEFCCEPLRASEILDHERLCRQGLSSARGLSASPTPPITPTPSSRPSSPWDDDNVPVIPCEFCTETLPFYLINEHQELCGRESDLLYPD